jgi:Domain of unknown function (DUF4190)/Domain of unknown function (DUF1707)
MTVSPSWYGPQRYDYSRMLASTADRERVLDVLKAGFAEGRLTQEEHDVRVGQAQAARTYGDLAVITADLPGGQQAPMVWPQPAPVASLPTPASSDAHTLAVASLVCGIAQIFTLGITGIPAIVLGHRALRQIRRTGEEGTGLATVGLTLGWIGITVVTFFVIMAALAVSRNSGAAP